MLKVTCIKKFKKNNRIYGYKIQDAQSNTKDVTSDQLKQAIKRGQITVTNLTLTSDNRLIDITPTSQLQISAEEQEIKNSILKAKVLGLPIKEIPTACNHKCYLISQSPEQYTLYIPDDVIELNTGGISHAPFTDQIKNLKETLKVVGGKNIQDINSMFFDCKYKYIDLSNFNTSNVTHITSMFYRCKAESINISNLDTSNVRTMTSMFTECEVKYIDFSNFNTSNVTDMCNMFCGCKIQFLDLRGFDTSNVIYMMNMFAWCEAQLIDLSSFNMSKVEQLERMFMGCQAQIKATDPKILEEYEHR